MIKKLLVAIMIALPMCVAAQAPKFGIVNVNNVFEAMPDKTTAQTTLETASKTYEDEFKKLTDELEKKYTEMMDSFDIQDADSRNTLILMCKTDLKMNQAIDCGDVDGYQKLSRVSDNLRKSAKFTAAQNKDKDNEQIDCTGVLVAVCEREGGFIPPDFLWVDVKHGICFRSIRKCLRQ